MPLRLVTESEASSSAGATEEDDGSFIFIEDVDVFQKLTQSKAELESLQYFEDHLWSSIP